MVRMGALGCFLLCVSMVCCQTYDYAGTTQLKGGSGSGGGESSTIISICAYWVIKKFNLGWAWIGTKVVLQDWKKRLDGGEVVRCCVYHRFLSNAHWERVCLCKINLIKRNIQIERHWDRSSWAPQMPTYTNRTGFKRFSRVCIWWFALFSSKYFFQQSYWTICYQWSNKSNINHMTYACIKLTWMTTVSSRAAVAGNGDIIVGTLQGSVYRLNSTGAQIWKVCTAF